MVRPTTVALTFNITGIQSGDVVRDGPRQVEVVPDTGVDLDSVTFNVDGETVVDVSEGPFEFTLDPGALAAGEHRLDLTVIGADGQIDTERVNFSVERADVVSPWLILLGIGILLLLIAFFLLWRRRRRPTTTA
jgi:LPXTG-motif cell wall-anchored protein